MEKIGIVVRVTKNIHIHGSFSFCLGALLTLKKQTAMSLINQPKTILVSCCFFLYYVVIVRDIFISDLHEYFRPIAKRFRVMSHQKFMSNLLSFFFRSF